MSKTRRGAASAASRRGRFEPRPSKVADNLEVIDWVREARRRGLTPKQMVVASHEGTHGYPASAKRVSDGSLSAIYSVLADRDRADREPPAPKRPSRDSGRRLRQIHEQRRKSGASELLDLRGNIMKAVGALEWVEIPDIGLSEIESDAIAMIFDDLTILSRWTDEALSAVIAHMDDLGRQRKIQMLRDRAVDPSSTENERESAAKLATLLEEKRNAARLEKGA